MSFSNLFHQTTNLHCPGRRPHPYCHIHNASDVVNSDHLQVIYVVILSQTFYFVQCISPEEGRNIMNTTKMRTTVRTK